MKELYVQYGCGFSAPLTWRNFDASPTLRFERIPIVGRMYNKNQSRFPNNVEYGDIVAGLPVPDQSCTGVYCSHVLEHFSLEDFKSALENTYRLLEIGGIFRLVVPDLKHAIHLYNSDESADAAYNFLKQTSLGKEKRPRGLHSFIIEWFGNSQHLWMWDFKSLVVELSKVGFCEIRRAKLGDNPDKMFAEVEDKSRWSGCLGVECKRK